MKKMRIDSNRELMSKTEKGNIISRDFSILKTIRECNEPFCAYTFENLDRIDTFLWKKNLHLNGHKKL